MKIPLNFKVTGFISFIMLIVAMMSAVFFIISYREGLEREISARGKTMAESMARSIDEGLAAENLDLISHVKKLGYVEDVILVQVFSTLWLPIDSYPDDKFGTPPDAGVAKHFETSLDSIHHRDGDLFDFYSPVFFHQFEKSKGKKYIIGYVRLMLTPERSLASLNKIIQGYVTIFLAVAVVTILVLTSFVRRKVLTPVLNLQRSVSASLHESLPEPVPVEGQDEIAELSRSFNTMIYGLREREEKLHGQTIELEEEIAERQHAQEVLQDQAAKLEEEVMERQLAQEDLAVKQQQLEALNSSLEIRVAEAVSDLRSKDQMLIQQGRLAAMGEMIHNIAHQWRQPLNNVGLIVQNLQLSFLEGSLSKDELDKDITSAMDHIVHMSRTIDDFRNFFSADKEKQSFVVNNAVTHALDFIGATLANCKIRSDVRSDGVVTAIGYQNEYAQVLLNILSNARDVLVERKIATPFIHITVTIENGRSVVTIRDNGGGIAENVLSRIFDPYFTTKEQGKGTGIGLYMSKAIIEQNMDGHLTARNVEDGAEFRIEV